MNLRTEYHDWMLYLKAKCIAYNTLKTQEYIKWSMLTIVLSLLVVFGFLTGINWS